MLGNVLLVLLKPILQNFMEIKQTLWGQPKQQHPGFSNVFNKMNTENETNANFAAAFGHAGIPCVCMYITIYLLRTSQMSNHSEFESCL